MYIKVWVEESNVSLDVDLKNKPKLNNYDSNDIFRDLLTVATILRTNIKVYSHISIIKEFAPRDVFLFWVHPDNSLEQLVEKYGLVDFIHDRKID